MASFFDQINANRIKSIMLMIVFSAVFIAFIYVAAAFYGFGSGGALLLGLVVTIVYALFVYSAGDRVILKISGAQPADKDKYAFLYDTVEGLALASQVKTPRVYVINDPNPNAFATGRNKNAAAICVTTGLLSMMSKRELEGVIAHEMSHVYNNDIQFMMVAIVFAGVIGLVAAIMRNSLWFGFGMGRDRDNGGGVLLLIGIAFAIIAPLVAMLIKLAISRRREYMADANGARLIRDPQALANALGKIKTFEDSIKGSKQRGRGSTRANVDVVNALRARSAANEALSSLYFANPLSTHLLANILSTHPPLEDRIAKLEHMY